MSSITHYVAGFMFDHAKERVALIRKTKPVWQAGKLNGIGGKIEDGETPRAAMAREFGEETGKGTHGDEWSHFLNMTGARDGFSVDFFAMVGGIDGLQAPEEEKTGEKIEIIRLLDVHPLRDDMIENLPWLISLALDHLNDARPHFVQVEYNGVMVGGAA